MLFHRKPAELVTPSYEDGGIFKTDLIRITVHVIPQFGQNSRGDIVIKGFVEGDGGIDLIFPGRRKKYAVKLQNVIQRQWTKYSAMARQQGHEPELEQFRCPVDVEGTWRARFRRDDQGMETRNHQLYAARWAFKDRDGMTVVAGEPVAR